MLVRNKLKQFNATFLEWLCGLTDAIGTFIFVQNNSSNSHFLFKLEFGVSDYALALYIKHVLKAGYIINEKNTLTGKNLNVCFVIDELNQLHELIIPIFWEYTLLTNKKKKQFVNLNKKFQAYVNPSNHDLAILPLTNYPLVPVALTINSLASVGYIHNWLIVFINGNGWFKYNSNECAFALSICNRNELPILDLTQAIFNMKASARPITIYNPIAAFNPKYIYNIETSGKEPIQNLLTFFDNTPAKLEGVRKAQLLNWVHYIGKINRYKSVHIPASLLK